MTTHVCCKQWHVSSSSVEDFWVLFTFRARSNLICQVSHLTLSAHAMVSKICENIVVFLVLHVYFIYLINYYFAIEHLNILTSHMW